MLELREDIALNRSQAAPPRCGLSASGRCGRFPARELSQRGRTVAKGATHLCRSDRVRTVAIDHRGRDGATLARPGGTFDQV